MALGTTIEEKGKVSTVDNVYPFKEPSNRDGGLYQRSEEIRRQRTQSRLLWGSCQFAKVQPWIRHEDEDNLKFCWRYAVVLREREPKNCYLLAKLLRHGILYGPPAYFVTLATCSQSIKWDDVPTRRWRSELECEVRLRCGGRVPANFIPELSQTGHRHAHSFIWLPDAYRKLFSSLRAEEIEVRRLCRRIWHRLVPCGSCQADLLYTYVDWCRAANYCAKNACIKKPGAKFQALGKFLNPDRVRVPLLAEPPGESSSFWWPVMQGLVGKDAIERSRWRRQQQ